MIARKVVTSRKIELACFNITKEELEGILPEPWCVVRFDVQDGGKVVAFCKAETDDGRSILQLRRQLRDALHAAKDGNNFRDAVLWGQEQDTSRSGAATSTRGKRRKPRMRRDPRT